jgi:predicted RNA polymerase sigma factor
VRAHDRSGAHKRTIRDDETPYRIQGAEGLPTALAIIYLIFNEGVYP